MFFITLLFVSMFLVYFFALLWRTWEGSIHLFYNMGNGSELEGLKNFKAGNSYFVYSFPTRFFYYHFLIMGYFYFVSSTHLIKKMGLTTCFALIHWRVIQANIFK